MHRPRLAFLLRFAAPQQIGPFVCATLLSLLVFATPVVAAAKPRDCHVKRDVGTHALDELTWKQLNAVYQEVGKEKYDEAYDDLQRMLGRSGSDKYLRAILNQALAQVEWARGHYDASLRFFETAVELNTLPNKAHFSLMYQIAQLYFMKDRYDEALDRLDLWFCTVPADEVTSAAYVLQASIYAQKEDYAGTLKAIDAAIAMDEHPKESWYQMKLAAQYDLKQYPQAAETLHTLVSGWPDKRIYWVQLAQIYYRLKQEGKALAVLAMAYRAGLLDKQSDIVFLSSLYSNSEIPYKAAEVLQRGIRDGIVKPTEQNWTVVADTWYAAEELEKALAAYEQASKVSKDGAVDLRRGYILVDLERWTKAQAALSQALDKGGLDDHRMGEAYLLRGMAEYNLGNLDGAGADWGRAEHHKKTREAARQWLNQLQQDRRRRDS